MLKKGLKKYINDWKFKHPDPTDFKRIMENISGLELDWYFEQFVETTNTIDYEVFNVEPTNNGTVITLRRIGDMPMPIDIVISDQSDNNTSFSIPLRIMRGNKSNDSYLNDSKHFLIGLGFTNITNLKPQLIMTKLSKLPLTHLAG